MSNDFDSSLDYIVSMGFTTDMALAALRACNNDVTAACLYITDSSSGIDGCVTSNGNADVQDDDVIIDEGLSEDSPSDNGFPEQALRHLHSLIKRGLPISYRKDDCLDRCLTEAISMIMDGSFSTCESCIAFVDNLLPCVVSSLVNAPENVDFDEERLGCIHQGCLLIIKLCAVRLNILPASGPVARMMGELLCAENRFHKMTKNRSPFSFCELAYNDSIPEIKYADQSLFISAVGDSLFGPLLEMIEEFGHSNGFMAMLSHFERVQNTLTIEDAQHLLRPLCQFAHCLRKELISSLASEGIKCVVNMVDGLTDKMIRDTGVRMNVKQLISECSNLNKYATAIDGNLLNNCRLDFLLKCMRSSQLDAKMHALSELGEIVCQNENADMEDCGFTDWLKRNNILDIVLSGNMDQVAYVEKIKPILSYMSKFFNDKDITYVWSLRKGRMGVSGDNFGQLLLHVASGFDLDQMETLIGFFNKCFQSNEVRMIDRIFLFCRDIGMLTRKEEVQEKMVHTLWDLIRKACAHHHPSVVGFQAHIDLIEHLRKGSFKEEYVRILVDKLLTGNDGDNLMTNLQHLRGLLSIPDKLHTPGPANFSTSTIMTRRRTSAIGFGDVNWDLDDDNECLRRRDAQRELLRESHLNDILIKEIIAARKIAYEKYSALGDFVIPGDGFDSSYTDPCLISIHSDMDYGRVLHIILEMILLLHDKEFDLLTSSQLNSLWTSLVEAEQSSETERSHLFTWLLTITSTLSPDIQRELLDSMCELEVKKINNKGFDFLMNLTKKMGVTDSAVPIAELSWWHRGISLLWRILVESDDEQLVKMAMEKLIQSTSDRLDLSNEQRHLHFLEQSNIRLDVLRRAYFDRQGEQASPGSLLKRMEDIRTDPRPSSACSADDQKEQWKTMVQSLSNDVIIRCIHRLLSLICEYVEKGDCDVKMNRINVAHGGSFFGSPVDIVLRWPERVEDRSILEIRTHTKETIFSLRTRVQHRLGLKNVRGLSLYRMVGSQDNCERVREQVVNSVYDWKTLEQLGIGSSSEEVGLLLKQKRVELVVKAKAVFNASSLRSDIIGDTNCPGVMITKAPGVFEMLHQLLSINNSSVRHSCRRLLSLIPTDPTTSTLVSKLIMDPPAGRQLLHAQLDLFQPYRLLYCLESLYSRIMPVKWDQDALRKADETMKAAVNGGLVDILLKIVTCPHLLPPVPLSDRMCIFEIAQSLLSNILIGESRLRDQLRDEKKAGEKVQSVQWGGLQAPSHVNLQSKIDPRQTILELRQFVWNCVGGWMSKPGCPAVNGDVSSPLHCQSESPPPGCNFWAGGDTSAVLSTSPHVSVIQEEQPELSDRELTLCREALYLLLRFTENQAANEKDIAQSLFHWETLFNEGGSKEFWMDVLLHAKSRKIRETLIHHLSSHCLYEDDNVRKCLLKLFMNMKRETPFWMINGNELLTNLEVRQRINSRFFFILLCETLRHRGSVEEFVRDSIGIGYLELVDEQYQWITTYQTSDNVMCNHELIIATGHMMLLSVVLPKLPLEWHEGLGRKLIAPLIKTCLFQWSFSENDYDLQPLLCALPEGETRATALRLLEDLCCENTENTLRVVELLQPINDQVRLIGWDHESSTFGRQNGHVGLKNDGGTCYMNAILQQLFFIPGVAKQVVSTRDIDPRCSFDGATGALFIELQRIFAHLAGSTKEYYVPRGFWQTFRFFDEDRLDTKMQHDAVDFFTALVDKCDTVLEKLNRPLIFKPRLGGKFSYEYICYGCWHRYTGRDEEFMCVNLELHGDSLEECFEHYVDGEILEGDNAYRCEKCAEKRSTLRRTAFRELPDTLTIQLKRFSYDYTGRQARKNDQYCAFPEQIDMTPFTCDARSVNESELEELFESVSESAQAAAQSCTSSIGISVPKPSPSVTRLSCGTSPGPSPNSSFNRLGKQRRRRISTVKSGEEYRYELVGVLAHHGLAAAGHYYSFVKERKGDCVVGYWEGRWLEANDTKISEFNCEGDERAHAWFGGTYREERTRANSINGNIELPKERSRAWNAYVLFYDRIKDDPITSSSAVSLIGINSNEQFPMSFTEEDILAGSSHVSSPSRSVLQRTDKESLLDVMPDFLCEEVARENRNFERERSLYSCGYIRLCSNLTQAFVERSLQSQKRILNLEEPIFTDVQEEQFCEVAKFYMSWCVNVLWRLSDDLCTRKELDLSMSLITEMVKKSNQAASILCEVLAECSISDHRMSPDPCFLFTQLCMVPSYDLRALWWEKLLPVWLCSLAHSCEIEGRVPSLDNPRDPLDLYIERILFLITEHVPMHRLRVDNAFTFLKRYLTDEWKRTHFIQCNGLTTIVQLIHSAVVDWYTIPLSPLVTELSGEQCRILFENYFTLLFHGIDTEIHPTYDIIIEMFCKPGFWTAALKIVYSFARKSNIRRSFSAFAYRIIHGRENCLICFVDAVSHYAESLHSTGDFTKLLTIIVDIEDEFTDWDLFVQTMKCPPDVSGERVGLLRRLTRWSSPNQDGQPKDPVRARNLLAAYNDVINDLDDRRVDSLGPLSEELLRIQQLLDEDEIQQEALDLSTQIRGSLTMNRMNEQRSMETSASSYSLSTFAPVHFPEIFCEPSVNHHLPSSTTNGTTTEECVITEETEKYEETDGRD